LGVGRERNQRDRDTAMTKQSTPSRRVGFDLCMEISLLKSFGI
jgi:hypothetical protein